MARKTKEEIVNEKIVQQKRDNREIGDKVKRKKNAEKKLKKKRQMIAAKGGEWERKDSE